MRRFPFQARGARSAVLLAASLAACGPTPGRATTASLGRVWAASEGFELESGAGWGAGWGAADALPELDLDAAAGSGVRLVVGPPDEAAVADLLARLPLETPDEEREARGWFRCLERLQNWREGAVVATLEDPARAGRPVVLAASRHEARALAALREALAGPEPWRPRLRVFERGEVVLEVRLAAGGAARLDTVVDHAARRGWDALEVREDSDGWTWRAAPGLADPAAWSAALRAPIARLAWAGVATPPRLEVVRAPTVDALVGVGPAQRGARYDARESRLVWGEPAADGPLALAEGLLVAELGAPSIPWLARAAAQEADLPGDRLLAACAEFAGDACTLDELLDPAAPARSGRVLDPKRALLWRVAREELGDERLVELWTAPSGLAALASAWDAALERVREIASTLDVPEPEELPAAGALVELPVAPTGSLGSRACLAALERAGDAGARAVLLRVHVAPPAEGEDVHALEGDAAVLWAVQMARTLDLAVALSAEVLASPSGVREGDLVLASPAEWRAYFDRSRRAVEHVAVLAREAGAAALVLNGGAPETTRTVVDAEMTEPVALVRRVRDEGWRELLRVVRRRFDGRVVLACAGPAHVGFLDELDAVLVELFPDSLSTVGRAEEARRISIFEGRIERALGHHPRTILEVGFRARAQADPGPEAPGGAADPEAQRALFAALAAALDARTARVAPAPAGVWVRGFGVAPGERDPRGYALAGRPAAAVLDALWR